MWGAAVFMILKEHCREEEAMSTRSTQRMGDEAKFQLALGSIWLIGATAIESVLNAWFHQSHHQGDQARISQGLSLLSIVVTL